MTFPKKDTNRFQFLIYLIIFGSLLLAGRLFQKQIIQYKHYQVLAQKQYLIEKEIPQERGEIFMADKYDDPSAVAVNLKFFDLLVIPKNINDPKIVSQKLSSLIGLSEKEIYEKINNKKPYIPPIKKKLTFETAKKIEDLKLTGVLLIPNPGRFYPEKNLASHVIGFVDANQKGRYGVEGYYDQVLRGQSGAIETEKENLSQFLNLSDPEIIKGSDLYLTIDRNIQFIAEQKLAKAVEDQKAESGSIIIADPKTGKILAMASVPNFNPNQFNEVKNFDVFVNPAIAYSYEPGSIFKIFGMAAAIDSGKVTPETEGVFGSSVNVSGYKIKTSTGLAYGRETMTQILEHSDNVGMVWVAQTLGKELFNKYLENFGFDKDTGIDLETESVAELLPLKQWRAIHLATMSFGQGIAVTPLQLAVGLMAIANQGKIIQPRILEKVKHPSGKIINLEPKEISQPISSETAKKISEMMVSVTEKGFGKKARVEGYRVAGKTGTAQIPDPQKKGYLEEVNICSFAGFAPADNPAFVMIVRINKPKIYQWAEDSTAPVFGEMAKWLLNYLQIPPQQ